MSVDELRTAFRAAALHHVVIPEVLTPPRRAALRAELDGAGFVAFDEPDRGRGEVNRAFVAPALFDELRAVAEAIVERPLGPASPRWLRLRHRDYALMKGDARDRAIVGDHVELTLELSAAATGQGEIVYSDGQAEWVVAPPPGGLAVVARTDGVFRYDRYLSVAVGDAVLHRLRLALPYA